MLYRIEICSDGTLAAALYHVFSDRFHTYGEPEYAWYVGDTIGM